MSGKGIRRLIAASWIGLLSLCAWPRWAAGYAEEPIYFRDPANGQVTDEEVCTLHSDLTLAMALAAGFSEADAARLSVWDQLVDSERLGSGDTVTYTNCLGAVKPWPSVGTACPGGAGTGDVVWPMTFDPTCTTSRFGPYSPFFHFPHQTPDQLGALKEWGWGRTSTLYGYAAYAWGNAHDNVLNAACRVIQWEEIETGIPAGTLEAFGTYLHSLRDSYSHRDCVAALDALGQENL